jgi:hypothetical protein
MMRTTITLDDDVAERVRAYMQETGVSFKGALNGMLRLGFETRRARKRAAPYSAPAFDLGRTMPGIDIDRIAETLELLEGPTHP